MMYRKLGKDTYLEIAEIKKERLLNGFEFK